MIGHSVEVTDKNMTLDRHQELERNQELTLTQREIAEGWFFCCEWDGMLIHESHPEAECCSCAKVVRDDGKHRVIEGKA